MPRPRAVDDEIPDRTSLVSVDVLAVRLADGQVRYATVERAAEPFLGRPALPGVLLLEGERLATAGERALRDKAGLAATAIGQLVVFDEPSRDPRGATLSAALWAVVPAGDGEAVTWRSFDENVSLWNDLDFTRSLTGARFAVGDALAATTSLFGEAPDRGNLNKKLTSVPGLQRAGHGTGRGRPSLWRWQDPGS